MLELVVIAVVAGMALALVHVIVKNVWVSFRWNILGIPPNILNEALIDETVKIASVQFDQDLIEFEKNGFELTPEGEQQYRTQRMAFLKSVIEKYIDLFARRA